MSEKWIQEVKRVQNEYKKQGINLTYQQSMLLAKDTYNQIKNQPTQPPPPVKVEPEKIPPFKARSAPVNAPPKPRLAPHPYDYSYSYAPPEEYRPPPPKAPGRAPPPTGRGRGRPRVIYEEEATGYFQEDPYYAHPPPRRPPPRYRYDAPVPRQEAPFYEYEE